MIRLPHPEPGMAKWRWTFVSMSGGNVLHRLAFIDRKHGLEPADEEDSFEWYVAVDGSTVCGRPVTGAQGMPGLLSRMGAKRCTRCCDLLHIPRGNGIPLNSEIDEPTEWQP